MGDESVPLASLSAEPRAEATAPPVLVVLGRCDLRVWGLTAAARLERGFARAGVTRRVADGAPLPQGAPVIAARADYVLDEKLMTALAKTPGVVLTAAGREPGSRVAVAAHAGPAQAAVALDLLRREALPAGLAAPAGLRLLGPAELGSSYNEQLRKRAVPFLFSLRDTPVAEIERQTFGASYKGATDFVTKWLWPLPARHVPRWAAELGIGPSTVTTASLVLVFVATWLFAQGHFVAGAAVAWLMTFLDTVDGKLARVTLTSTKWGNIYDHGIDLIHPPFWWGAWWVGLHTLPPGTLAPGIDAALWIILAGYLAGRLMEGLFIKLFGIETHIWRPADYAFRTVTARRNPNLAILTLAAIAGAPDWGFVLVAAWTILSLLFHAVRIVQAALLVRRGGEVRSYLTEPA